MCGEAPVAGQPCAKARGGRGTQKFIKRIVASPGDESRWNAAARSSTASPRRSPTSPPAVTDRTVTSRSRSPVPAGHLLHARRQSRRVGRQPLLGPGARGLDPRARRALQRDLLLLLAGLTRGGRRPAREMCPRGCRGSPRGDPAPPRGPAPGCPAADRPPGGARELVLAEVAAVGRNRRRVASRLALGDPRQHRRRVADGRSGAAGREAERGEGLRTGDAVTGGRGRAGSGGPRGGSAGRRRRRRGCRAPAGGRHGAPGVRTAARRCGRPRPRHRPRSSATRARRRRGCGGCAPARATASKRRERERRCDSSHGAWDSRQFRHSANPSGSLRLRG